ncbi:hypothetical protein [uncultured Sphaerochaeta sp.]|uniref:hypothetical protein n=1 Tax=uncultured Sphaerochaeta sp. TaxID=886478 RepID=UPI002A0A8D17|nr:hypothetical protein [uncultured Sphaerochaeta sp.]
MRKTLIGLLMLVCLSSLWAEESNTVFVSADASGLDVLWNDSLQARVDFGFRLSSGFGLRLPFSFFSDTTYNDVSLLELGLFLDYRPFYNGFFISVSLFQMGFYGGLDKPAEPNPTLNEVAFGFTWHFFKDFFVEPRLLIRDPNGVFENEYDSLSNSFPGYSQVRFSISFGWDFLAIPKPEMRNEDSIRQEGGGVQ